MIKIILLNEELGSQMQIYLALCDGYKIEIADNIENAMYLLRKLKPEILLLDFNLDYFNANGKTGIDFIKKIKRKYTDLKVLTILDSKDKSKESELQENGADEILYKPIKNRRLLTNVKKLSTSMVLDP